MTPKIKLVLSGIHMGLGHVGLTKIAKDHGYNSEMPTGLTHEGRLKWAQERRSDLLVFINGKHDKIKIMSGAGDVFGYLKPHHGQKIALEAIQYIPLTFGGAGFSYDRALRLSLMARLARGETSRKSVVLYRPKTRHETQASV